MDDILACPICKNKFRSLRHANKKIHQIDKSANYTERVCSGMNHSLQIFVDESNRKVDFLKLSLSPDYSRYLEVDFFNQKCRISCLKDGKPEYIEVPKMVELDFPDLVKLKERISIYVVFS